MFIIGKVNVRSYEKGLLFRDREFKTILNAGKYWFFDPLNKIRVETVSMRSPWLVHEDLDVIVRAGVLGDEAIVLDLKDHQRALVWVDGRFARVLGPGQHAIWKTVREIRYEMVDAREIRFDHKEFNAIQASDGALVHLTPAFVAEGFAGVLYKDGAYVDTLGPGQYLFWKNMGKVKLCPVDMRETVLDVSGQEIMTADKVTLRMNAVLTCRVTDPRKSVEAVEDSRQAIYREAQLALRAVVGGHDLDALLSDKEKVTDELAAIVRKRAAAFGIEVIALGIRDLILPGEMKTLMNRVIEAKKKADADLITRREETASMRSQANTAKILENNPTLMRLRELDLLEKIAGNSQLQVVLGEKGLADRIVNLL
jgi:regulator of protease activity HflC (stomatin/prohibitin superfamily)